MKPSYGQVILRLTPSVNLPQYGQPIKQPTE